MTKSVTLPAGATLSAQVRYNIETDFDYAYVTVDGNPVADQPRRRASPETAPNWVDADGQPAFRHSTRSGSGT